MLKVFFLYRFVLSSLFVIMYHSIFSLTVIKEEYLQLYNYTSKIYLGLAIVSGLFAFWRVMPYTIQAQSVIFTDIVAITLLMHSCGGISSGFGILLAASLAASGLLIGGRCSMVFAALATVSILAEQVYAMRFDDGSVHSYPTAGMLGATFFMTAFLSYVLAKRSEQSDLLTNRQQQTIVTLEELNRYIIQHLQSGIVIINKYQQVQMLNEAALKLLFIKTQPLQLADISPQLCAFFQEWLNDGHQDFFTLQRPQQANLHLRFNLLKTRHETFYMIILDDISLYNQRLQQGVLASLGRLTASIAHEIRNPLSAITHAAQLLSESPELSPEDLRLTEIILNHGGRVNKIITDILQSSRRNPSNRKIIELRQWLKDYLEEFRQERGIVADSLRLGVCSQDVSTLMDAGHLKQIMDNLCQNALRYGQPEKGGIVIELDEMDSHPCITVIDNGELLSANTVSHLFEPFFTTSPTGTGLGLYLSKELAELNQATLCYVVSLGEQKKNGFKLQLPNAEKTIIEI